MAINNANIHGWNIEYGDASSDEFGRFWRGVFAGNTTGLAVSQTGTPSMAVSVAQGDALLTKNATSSVVATVKNATTVPVPTADTSNPRIDAVVIYQDTAVSTALSAYVIDGAGGSFKLAVISGTPSTTPTAISDSSVQSQLGAGKPWTRLANVTVPAGAGNIINSNIADARVPITMASAKLPVYSFAIGNTMAVTAPFDCTLEIQCSRNWWGFAGGLAAYQINLPAGLTSVSNREAVTQGHDTTAVQTTARRVFTGAKSGQTYTFSYTIGTGTNGGSAGSPTWEATCVPV